MIKTYSEPKADQTTPMTDEITTAIIWSTLKAHGQSFCNLVGADGQRAHQIGVDHIDLIHHHGDDVEDTGNEHHDPCLRQESVFEAFGKKGQH